MQIPLLFEDQDLAVVAKPAGVVVNNAETIQEETLQDWWQTQVKSGEQAKTWQEVVPADFSHEYGSPEQIFVERGGIVHRLDKETSGVVVLAKNPGSLIHLLAQFRNRQVQKTYVCLVHGKFQVLRDTLSLPLSRSTENRTRFTVDSSGRTAETAYEVQEYFPSVNIERVAVAHRDVKNLRKKLQNAYQGFSLVQCQPKTGRTHQIRVHMKHIHHPIVSDETYLGSKRSALDVLWCPRLFLHAQKLEFTHPRSGEKLEFTVDLPSDLQEALTYLSHETH